VDEADPFQKNSRMRARLPTRHSSVSIPVALLISMRRRPKRGSSRIGALFVAEEARTAGDPDVRQSVLAFTAEARVPVASTHQNFARYGALIAMGPSIPAPAAAAAGYVNKS